ncbi:MAG TPA: hypothetical protein VFR87_16170 [Nocardioidaceae bacterium]|nr:hypothetical protein [Nocardioidaceae bacterium]
MKAALVVSWTGPRAGREALGVEYGREVDEYWGKLAAEGKCSEPKWFWAMSGPSLWIVEGDYETLLMASASPEAQKLSLKGPLLAEDFKQEVCMAGREEMLKPYGELLKEMKLA